jgi:hypothetical protein
MAEGVEFEEDKGYSKPRPGMVSPGSSGFPASSENAPKMVQWLIAHGLAKSASGAQAVLIGIVVVNFVVIFIIMRYLL